MTEAGKIKRLLINQKAAKYRGLLIYSVVSINGGGGVLRADPEA